MIHHIKYTSLLIKQKKQRKRRKLKRLKLTRMLKYERNKKNSSMQLKKETTTD